MHAAFNIPRRERHRPGNTPDATRNIPLNRRSSIAELRARARRLG
jgi:hypothetical protein